jgi:hypothetical protein
MRRSVHLLAGIALLSACGGEQIPTGTSLPADVADAPLCAARAGGCAQVRPATAANLQTEERFEGRGRSTLREELATIRRVTAPFRDFAAATAAGWSTEITACLTNPAGPGAMGFHYGNAPLINGTAHVDKPQLLLYEPERNGRLRLVAVEYIIPYSFHSRDAAPPVLLGQQFMQFDAFQVWGLHAWIWKDNPSGLFAPWNPRVTCEFTTDVASMAH